MRHFFASLSLLLGSSLCLSAQNQFDVLVISIPNKYHYEYIPIARQSFEGLAKHHQFGLTWTHEAGVFEGDLSRFATIVFMNTPAEVLNEKQRAALQAYVRQGHGVVLVHKAIATARQWDWYEEMIGRSFRIHPYVQTAVVRTIDPTFPATFSVPSRWIWSDEWYEYDAPRSADLHTVLAVDESTYDPTKIWPGQHAEGMGADHPVAWYHTFEGSRVFVTALGHMPELYTDKTYLDHLYGGIYWAATGKGIDRTRQ
jgi:uncharacterized protein